MYKIFQNEEHFKSSAALLKKELSKENIEYSSEASLNLLARTFGHKDYHAYQESYVPESSSDAITKGFLVECGLLPVEADEIIDWFSKSEIASLRQTLDDMSAWPSNFIDKYHVYLFIYDDLFWDYISDFLPRVESYFYAGLEEAYEQNQSSKLVEIAKRIKNHHVLIENCEVYYRSDSEFNQLFSKEQYETACKNFEYICNNKVELNTNNKLFDLVKNILKYQSKYSNSAISVEEFNSSNSTQLNDENLLLLKDLKYKILNSETKKVVGDFFVFRFTDIDYGSSGLITLTVSCTLKRMLSSSKQLKYFF